MATCVAARDIARFATRFTRSGRRPTTASAHGWHARLRCSCYESLTEKLSEDYHATPDLLKKLNPGVALDGAVRHARIPGGRYAVLVHTGPYAELPNPYRWLFGEWLPRSGEEAGDGPMVEEYLNDWRRLPPSEWRTAVCLPLR